MSNLNPREYRNGKLIETTVGGAIPADAVAVAAGETVNTASRSITLGPAKAIAAFVATVAVAFLTALGSALTGDGIVTGPEWVTIALATIVGSGLVGGAAYVTRTTVTGKPVD